MRSFYIIPLFLLGSIICSCCKHGQNGDEPEPEEQTTEFETSFNPDDPIIMNAYTPSKDTLYVMGEKDSDGRPISIETMIIKPYGSDGPTEIHYDEELRIDEIIAENGVRMLFEWLEDNKAIALTLIEPNTGEQLNTLINLEAKDNENESTKSNTLPNRRSGATRMTVEATAQPTVTIATHPTKGSSNAGFRGIVSVTQCGLPADGLDCYVNVYEYDNGFYSNGKGKFRERVHCKSIGDGLYEYTLTSNSDFTPWWVLDGTTQGNICSLYFKVFNAIYSVPCDGNTQLGPTIDMGLVCENITAALILGGVTAVAAAEFALACPTVVLAFNVYCSIKDELDDMICSKIKQIHWEVDYPLYLEPTVNALPKNRTGVCYVWSPGTIPDRLYVDMGRETVIGNFELTPSAPVEGQDYVAVAYIGCVPMGSDITMDIVGTDNYSNSETTHISTTQLNYTAKLLVPGAASGVRDVCTVSVKRPDGAVISKRASLVFQ